MKKFLIAVMVAVGMITTAHAHSDVFDIGVDQYLSTANGYEAFTVSFLQFHYDSDKLDHFHTYRPDSDFADSALTGFDVMTGFDAKYGDTLHSERDHMTVATEIPKPELLTSLLLMIALGIAAYFRKKRNHSNYL